MTLSPNFHLSTEPLKTSVVIVLGLAKPSTSTEASQRTSTNLDMICKEAPKKIAFLGFLVLTAAFRKIQVL
jgi:hypothetical protein